MKLTHPEIMDIARKYLAYGAVAGMEAIARPRDIIKFANEIEAAVLAKAAPKFKVGDEVRLHGSNVIREVQAIELRPTYRLSDHSSRWTEGTFELVEEQDSGE